MFMSVPDTVLIIIFFVFLYSQIEYDTLKQR